MKTSDSEDGFVAQPRAAAMYLIWSNEHGAWWRPGRCGYTMMVQSAGRYARGEALAICANVRDGWDSKATPSEIPVRLEDVMECASRDRLRTVKTT